MRLRPLSVSKSPLLLLLLLAVGCEDERPPEAGAEPPPADPAARAASAGEEEGPVVVFLGTSLTAGLGLRDPDQRFPERLARLADSAGTPIRVVNAGVSGETSAGGLRRLDWVLDRSMDVLVVELGANDGLRGQEPESLEQNLRTIVQRARDRHPQVSIVLLGMQAPPNLGPEYTRRFRDVFPSVADAERTALVPFLLEGVAGVAALNQTDRIHPTAEGHRRMAGTVWPVLDSVLRAREGGR
jgi:acyl-CoA thioesterase-1